MSLVELEYNKRLGSMSGVVRIRRVASMYKSMFDMIAFQISNESPELSTMQVKKRVAERMYISDLNTLELVKRVKVS